MVTETLCDIAAGYAPDTAEYINIGGGFYGYIPPASRWADTPSFDDYAGVVCDVLQKNSWAKKQKPYL